MDSNSFYMSTQRLGRVKGSRLNNKDKEYFDNKDFDMLLSTYRVINSNFNTNPIMDLDKFLLNVWLSDNLEYSNDKSIKWINEVKNMINDVLKHNMFYKLAKYVLNA